MHITLEFSWWVTIMTMVLYPDHMGVFGSEDGVGLPFLLQRLVGRQK
jgi:hypothetical protein